MIGQLIDKLDTFEVVRDEIAAILATESASQMQLAEDAGRDPRAWQLRVFLERSNPWEEYLDAPPDDDELPIVNVSFDGTSFDGSRSNAVERQAGTGVYHIDCYGYARASDEAEGHRPGDQAAALEVHRVVRLVRNILMAGTYTYLGLRGTVWKRWLQSTSVFQPSIDGRALQQVVGARLVFQVDFSEFAPQVQGEELELVSATVRRAENGEVLLTASYETEDDESEEDEGDDNGD